MRLLVCGDRHWNDRRFLYTALDEIKLAVDSSPGERLEIISGMARGADTLAVFWAEANAVPCHKFPADWTRLGKKAGPMRNQRMLTEGNPELVLAFHDRIDQSKGTADMVRRARRAGIPVQVIRHAPNTENAKQ